MFFRYNNLQIQDALSTGEEKVMKARGETSDNTEGKSKMTVIENIFGSYLCNYRIKQQLVKQLNVWIVDI